jgi:virginiamycin B lyase
MTRPDPPYSARVLALLTVALLVVSGSGAAVAQTVSTVPIDEWTVPWPDTRPRDPFTDVAGGVWFVGQTGDYMARLDPATGSFARRDLPGGTGPHNLVVAEDGSIWVAGNRTAELQVSDPTGGLTTRIAMPDPAARDPHTLVFAEDGTLWFSVQNGNFVGRLKTASERFFSVTEIESGAGSVRHMHYDAARGELWFGTDAGTIGRADLSAAELP